MPPAHPPVLGGLTAAITKCFCFVLVCLPCLYILQDRQKLVESETLGIRGVFSLSNHSRSSPTTEIIDGQSIVWESVKSPEGVLLVFHGCSHSATDWWDQQGSCPQCIGLPEEKRIVATAVARRYVVVAFSSQDRRSRRCWDVVPPPRITADMQKTKNTVVAIVKREGWEKLPLFALGASSGGALAALIPFHLKLQGSCVQIMAVPAEVYKGAGAAVAYPFPPMLFVHMVRDGATGAGVAQDVAVLTAEGIAAKAIAVAPRPLTPSFFSDRISNVTVESSKQIFDALQTAGLTEANGLLKQDPRRTGDEWRAALKPHVEGQDLRPDLGAIPEELNLAWAGHEIVSDTTDEMLDWFESLNPTKDL